MSTEGNKALVRRVYEAAWNQGNRAVVDAVYAPHYVHPDPLPGYGPGLTDLKPGIEGIRRVFPDVHIAIEDQMAEGDKVASRWTMRGTHRGELLGIPPTGKPATFTGLVITRLSAGRIAEEWENFDQLGLLQQLDVIPTPGQTGG